MDHRERIIKLNRLQNDIHYQLRPVGATTMGDCHNDDCKGYARGGHACPDCLESELANLVEDENLAHAYRQSCEFVRSAKVLADGIMQAMESKIGDME